MTKQDVFVWQWGAIFGQFTNLDVSKRDRIAMILQAEVAGRGFAKIRELGELALGELVQANMSWGELVRANLLERT